jgi:exopolysaccharide production protein ExoZ
MLYGLLLIKKKLLFIPLIISLLAILYFILENYANINTSHFPLRTFAGYRVIEFFLGVLAGIFYKKIPFTIAYVFIICGLFLFFDSNLSEQTLLNFGLPSMLLVCGLAKIESVKKINIPAIFILLGDASYVIYLIHDPFLRDAILPLLKNSANLTIFNFSLLILLTIALGVLIHLYIEKPVMRYLNKKISFNNG